VGKGRHQRGVPQDEGPWFERLVLSTPAGEWSALGLVGVLVWIAVVSGLSISFAYDDWVLNQRAEVVQAQVIRANYDQRGPSFNAELHSPFEGRRVLVENIHQRPAAGEFIDLEVDPQKPTRVRDPQSRRWNPWDYLFISLVPVGAVIAWAHANRWLRHRRPPLVT
jgi:hypothetical protein